VLTVWAKTALKCGVSWNVCVLRNDSICTYYLCNVSARFSETVGLVVVLVIGQLLNSSQFQ
jgi:hypothetical protein